MNTGFPHLALITISIFILSAVRRPAACAHHSRNTRAMFIHLAERDRGFRRQERRAVVVLVILARVVAAVFAPRDTVTRRKESR